MFCPKNDSVPDSLYRWDLLCDRNQTFRGGSVKNHPVCTYARSHEKRRWCTVRFIYHKTRNSKELAKTKIVAPNLEI